MNLKHNKGARYWFDLSHILFKETASLSWQKNACSSAFYLDVFQRNGLIIRDQSVHPYVNDMSQSVKELQLWNPVECWFPTQSADTTTCFALGLHLVFMSCSFWCCWLMWFGGNCLSKGQALLVRKVNACNPLRRNPPIIAGKERGIFSLQSCQDYCLLLDVQQKCVQEHKYFFSAWIILM